jgi:hypothetical protein
MDFQLSNFQVRGWRWLVSLALGSSLILNAALCQARPRATYTSAPGTQVDPNTGFTGVQVPYTSIKLTNGRFKIRFINETGSAIDYQVIGDTGFRSLPGRSQMALENLRTPTTFTFRRADNGFLQVALSPDSKTGVLTMRVRETPDFATDRTSVYVDQNGSIYLN